MATPRRRSVKPAAKSSTPLDLRQRKLEEQTAKLEQEKQKYEQFLSDVPRIQAQRKQKEEEAIRSRSRAPAGRGSFNRIADKRHEVSMAGTMSGRPPRRRALKAERRQTQLISFGLVFLLALLVILLYSNWHQ